MAIRKQKKKVYKKAASRPIKQKRKITTHEKKHYAAAFIIGVTFLVILAILFFRYVADNNYKNVLGERTYIERQEAVDPLN